VTKITNGYLQYLTCPACNNPCTTIQSCQEAHKECMAEYDKEFTHSWCEDRRGTCTCGARLYVNVDGGYAELDEEEEEEEEEIE